MPLIDGVKMACAACIRGHRSTSCQHTDRPLLEVRKKGRPMTQCNHCRELRKVKQVHVRCACNPDESEAPKRVVKGKEKRTEAEHAEQGCLCDDTDLCTCAIPRNVASQNGRRYSTSTMPPPPLPTINAPRRSRSCCRSSNCSHADDDSSCCKGKAGSSRSESTQGSNCCSSSSDGPSPSTSASCCTNPPTPPEAVGFPTGLEIAGTPLFQPLDILQPERQLTPQLDPSWFDSNVLQQSRSRRYAPYPQPAQLISPVTGGSKAPYYLKSPIPNPFLPQHSPTLDAEALLWDQFLRGDPTEEQMVPVLNTTITPIPAPSHPAPSTAPSKLVPPASCTCTPCATHCVDPSSTAACAEMGNGDTCFDCTALQAALDAVEIETPGLGKKLYDIFAANFAPPGVIPPPYIPPTSGLPFKTSPLSNMPAPVPIPPPASEVTPALTSSTATTSPTACCCGSQCSCFICSGNEGHESQGEGCETCTRCQECDAINRTLDDLQKQFTESTPAVEITDLGLV